MPRLTSIIPFIQFLHRPHIILDNQHSFLGLCFCLSNSHPILALDLYDCMVSLHSTSALCIISAPAHELCRIRRSFNIFLGLVGVKTTVTILRTCGIRAHSVPR